MTRFAGAAVAVVVHLCRRTHHPDNVSSFTQGRRDMHAGPSPDKHTITSQSFNNRVDRRSDPEETRSSFRDMQSMQQVMRTNSVPNTMTMADHDKGLVWPPPMNGGGQERGMRSGARGATCRGDAASRTGGTK